MTRSERLLITGAVVAIAGVVSLVVLVSAHSNEVGASGASGERPDTSPLNHPAATIAPSLSAGEPAAQPKLPAGASPLTSPLPNMQQSARTPPEEREYLLSALKSSGPASSDAWANEMTAAVDSWASANGIQRSSTSCYKDGCITTVSGDAEQLATIRKEISFSPLGRWPRILGAVDDTATGPEFDVILQSPQAARPIASVEPAGSSSN